MTAPTLDVIADQVTTDLNAAAIAGLATAVRTWLPSLDLKDGATMLVEVVPNAAESEMLTRSSNLETASIEIQIVKRPATRDNTGIDAITRLVQSVQQFFFRRQLTIAGAGTAWVKAAAIDPLAEPETLEKKNLVLSVITLTIEVYP